MVAVAELLGKPELCLSLSDGVQDNSWDTLALVASDGRSNCFNRFTCSNRSNRPNRPIRPALATCQVFQSAAHMADTYYW